MNSITVDVDIEKDGKANVYVTTPKDQESLTVRESVHMLTAGICLIIKSSSKLKKGMKDFELLEEVHKHLNDDFVDVDSYSDGYINEEKFPKK